ncbi:MAG: hypothetical protein ACT4O9_15290 [Blastocatellia bacterium]
MTYKLARFLPITLLSLFFIPTFSTAQKTTLPTIDEIVKNAEKKSAEYVAAFKNLLAEETKTFLVYEKDGDVKKQRTVRSNFIVYQLSRSEDHIVEFRNVLAVDNKKITDSDNRAQDFFEKVVKSESSAKELERIEEESLRYDNDIQLNGLTLFQSVPLAENIRKSLQFTFNGVEMLEGHRVYVITYLQITPNPDILVNSKATESGRKNLLSYDIDLGYKQNINASLRGKFWIDAETFQTRREVRVLAIRPDKFTSNVTVSARDFEYQNSEFGILTPRKITCIDYRVDKKNKTTEIDLRAIFEYSKFSQADVQVKSAEIK